MPKINRYWNSDPDSLVEREPRETYELCKVCEIVRILELRESYQKYKRCLDNAWQCKKLSYIYTVNACNNRGWNIARYYEKKAELYRKWRKRWLKLAAEFKHNNEVK